MIGDEKGKRLPVALSIAGSDSGAGAGIQADLLTFAACEVFGTTAVTALTAQNPDGVTSQHTTPALVLSQQIGHVLDYFPVRCIKTGMLPTQESVATVTRMLGAKSIPIVVDPVLASTSGSTLSDGRAFTALRDALIPIATLVTPNLDEVEALLGARPTDAAGLLDAARQLVDIHQRAFLLKGGHLDGDEVTDIYARPGQALKTYTSPRVVDVDTHGSGCTLSAAITAHLAQGCELDEAVELGRNYLQQGLNNPLHVAGRRFIRHLR